MFFEPRLTHVASSPRFSLLNATATRFKGLPAGASRLAQREQPHRFYGVRIHEACQPMNGIFKDLRT